jgi:SAM-dependent methyltransferase
MGPAAPDPYAGFPPGFFQRADGRDDAVFYGPPRLVTHIDDAAIAAVAELYAELGIDGSAPTPRRVLDLMSSWVSHFRTPPADLVVLGMNAEELAANPAATQRLVHDLNADPRLPLPDADVDAAVCCVSIDYLTRPIEVLAEAARVLRPGAPAVITFSNRCFPTKAVEIWHRLDDRGRMRLVEGYLGEAGNFDHIHSLDRSPRRLFSDPLYAVVGESTGPFEG